jgi:hypothetical protein
MLWLWGWGFEQQLSESQDHDKELGRGVYGKVPRGYVEQELLKAILGSTRKSYTLSVKSLVLTFFKCLGYRLALDIYVQAPVSERPLPPSQVEKVVIDAVLASYDNASNGNKTRGGIKKALDTYGPLGLFIED